MKSYICLLPPLKWSQKEPPECDCDLDGAGDFESQQEACNNRFAAYRESMIVVANQEQAVKILIYKLGKSSGPLRVDENDLEKGKFYAIDCEAVIKYQHKEGGQWVTLTGFRTGYKENDPDYRQVVTLSAPLKGEQKPDEPDPICKEYADYKAGHGPCPLLAHEGEIGCACDLLYSENLIKVDSQLVLRRTIERGKIVKLLQDAFGRNVPSKVVHEIQAIFEAPKQEEPASQEEQVTMKMLRELTIRRTREVDGTFTFSGETLKDQKLAERILKACNVTRRV